MKLKLYMKDGSIEEYDVDSYDVNDIIKNTLKDVNLEDIDRVSTTETYVHSHKNINEFRRIISRITPSTNVGVSISDVTEYTFNLNTEGKLVDAIGIYNCLRIWDKFTKLKTHQETDVNLLDNLLRNMRFTSDIHNSLIMRFISKESGNVNLDYIFSHMGKDFNKTELKKLLLPLFKDIYGKKVEDIKIDNHGDKMALESIKSDCLDRLDKELREYLGRL